MVSGRGEEKEIWGACRACCPEKLGGGGKGNLIFTYTIITLNL